MDILLQDVFGIRREPIRSYTERDHVDGVFIDALRSDRHVVIYGSSKQGKTSLRNKHLSNDECHVVQCGPSMSTAGIYSSILRNAGATIESQEVATSELGGSAKTTLGFKVSIPFLGKSKSELEGGIEKKNSKKVHREFIGFDLGEAQSVGELLTKVDYDKYVIVEDFHYLPYETQRTFAFDLKAFHEMGLRFIILGIWREANLLLLHNGDLAGRITEVPVEPWRLADFEKVIDSGCYDLNISVDEDIKNELMLNAYGNVGMLQEFLKSLCTLAGIKHRQPSTRQIDDREFLKATFDEMLEQQRGRLTHVLDGIAAKSRTQGNDPLLLPYYLIQAVLKSSLTELGEGMSREKLLERIRDVHHRSDKETIRTSDVSHLLKRLPDIQSEMHPPLLYYDNNSRRLKLVDTRQLFVLANIDREGLAEEVPIPARH